MMRALMLCLLLCGCGPTQRDDTDPPSGISPRGRKSPATCYCPGVCAICGFTRHMAIHESEAETPEGPFGMHRFREQNDAARAAQGGET